MQVRRWSTPKCAALARMFAARSARSSKAMARPPARHHSTEIEPEPAPISHSKLARARGEGRQGQRADRAFGDLAVSGEQHRRRPEAREQALACGDLDGDGDGGLGMSVSSKAAAVVWRMRSLGPPRASSRVRSAVKPWLVSHCASSAGASASRSRQIARAPLCSTGRRRAKGAACKPWQVISSMRQPRRLAASEKVEGAGKALPFVWRKLGCEAAACAEPERIAGGEERDVGLCAASSGARENGTGHARPLAPAATRAR